MTSRAADARRDRTGAVTAQRRDAIRRVAGGQFAANGYQGASLRNIAVASGLAQGHLYYYYPSKQDLLYEIITVLQRRFNETMDAALERTTDPAQILCGQLADHVRILCENVTDATVSYESLRFLTPDHRHELVGKRDAYEVGLARLIDACRSTHPLSPTPTSLLAKVALGIVNWPYQWYRSDGAMPVDELAATLAGRAFAAMTR